MCVCVFLVCVCVALCGWLSVCGCGVCVLGVCVCVCVWHRAQPRAMATLCGWRRRSTGRLLLAGSRLHHRRALRHSGKSFTHSLTLCRLHGLQLASDGGVATTVWRSLTGHHSAWYVPYAYCAAARAGQTALPCWRSVASQGGAGHSMVMMMTDDDDDDDDDDDGTNSESMVPLPDRKMRGSTYAHILDRIAAGSLRAPRDRGATDWLPSPTCSFLQIL